MTVFFLLQNEEDSSSSRESIVMITKDNEKYKCILPQHETAEEVRHILF